jgi:hypothetical protein
MGRLSKFLGLPKSDRRLLVTTVLLVWAVRLGLWLIPFRVLRQLLSKITSTANAPQACFPVERVVWAVTVACRYVPAASCLTQALATKTLLARCGHPAIVRIGVARQGTGLLAHAWVESGGRVVIGGSASSLKRYSLLITSEGELL